MKNTTTLLFAALLVLITASMSCSTGSTTSLTPTGVTPSSAFSTLYPTITSCTLKHYASGHYTGAVAHVDADGNMVVTGYGSISGGTYKIRLTDSVAPPQINGFKLYRGGVDTLISAGNGIRRTTYTGGECYYIQIDGGALPQDAIVRGVFIDSL